ncbi:class E sortase [Streptomyces afghaniensis]|uniref:class E sortase n=1 Tax=Streptomyces afghaniensis TaxID=66865 RepID=UPI00278778D5|nr:class E sortase [Streptomyces afghaniensis]MDQ1021911.1 sortase A [Streptomyces afghaniensis]
MRRVIRLLSFGLILAGLTLGGLRLFHDQHSGDAYEHTQQALRTELRQSAAPPDAVQKEKAKPAPRDGEAFAVLRIPRFGPDQAPVIVEGVSQKALQKGPGHFPGTALPGEVGNVAVAGHRTGWGQPFHRLPELKKGDAIAIEWNRTAYTYRVTHSKVVEPTDVGVLLPVPGKPGARPDRARITLITCTDRGWDGTYVHRFVVWGELERS